MSSTSADTGAPHHHLVQAIPAPAVALAAAAAAAQPSNGRLTLDDIAKYFNIPIADAADTLGVCTSVLKRICRENGIIRWPYRKFLAGKTIEDIKKEAAREKSKEQAVISKKAKQNLDAQKMMPSTAAGLSTHGNLVQSITTGHGFSASGNMLQPQGNRTFQHGLHSTVQNQTRHIPSYFDDFKYGFPANGLSCASIKWWGSNSIESSEKIDSGKPAANKDEKQNSCKFNESSECMMIDDQSDGSSIKDSATEIEPSASLVSLRKRALEFGIESLQVGISNCEPYKLGKRKRLLLLQVFGSSLPDQWKDGCS